MLPFLDLAEEDCFGHAYIFHPCNMASPAHTHLKQDGLYAGQAGSLEDFFIQHMVLPDICTKQKGRNDDSPVYLDLCGEAERVTLPDSL